MVAPDRRTADLALQGAPRIAIQLNAGHAFTRSRDELVALVYELIAKPASAETPGETGSAAR